MLTNQDLFRAIPTELESIETDSTMGMENLPLDLDFLFDDVLLGAQQDQHIVDLSDIPWDDLFQAQNNTSNSSSSPENNVVFENSSSSNSNNDYMEEEETDNEDLEFLPSYQPPPVNAIKKTIRPYRRLKPRKTIPVQIPSSNLNNEDLDHGQPGQKLYLSDEEKYLLSQQNIKIPIKLPLTRQEDRILRAVRRRIRNKLSAKASRAKKQEQTYELERRTLYYEEENKKLRKQVTDLNQNNRGLVSLVRRLQDKLYSVTGVSGGKDFALVSDSLIGKHKLTSRDDVQRAVLPRYANEKVYKASQPTGGTYLLMFAVVFAIAFPMSMTTSVWQFGKVASPSSGEAGNRATGRVLLAYGPETLDEYRKSNHEEATITIEDTDTANLNEDAKRLDENVTVTSRNPLKIDKQKKSNVIVAA